MNLLLMLIGAVLFLHCPNEIETADSAFNAASARVGELEAEVQRLDSVLRDTHEAFSKKKETLQAEISDSSKLASSESLFMAISEQFDRVSTIRVQRSELIENLRLARTEEHHAWIMKKFPSIILSRPDVEVDCDAKSNAATRGDDGC